MWSFFNKRWIAAKSTRLSYKNLLERPAIVLLLVIHLSWDLKIITSRSTKTIFGSIHLGHLNIKIILLPKHIFVRTIKDLNYKSRFKKWCDLFIPLNESELIEYKFNSDESLTLHFHNDYRLYIPICEQEEDEEESGYFHYYIKICNDIKDRR